MCFVAGLAFAAACSATFAARMMPRGLARRAITACVADPKTPSVTWAAAAAAAG